MENNNCLLRAVIVADTHMDIRHSHPDYPVGRLCDALQNAKQLQSDAFVVVGDVTSHGNRFNWDLAREAFARVPDCADTIVLAVGNHDGWGEGEEEGYDAVIPEYYAACADITGSAPQKPYFSVQVNGYTFLCLGNEHDRGCDADISETQVAWLDAELARATADGKPVFVFCHQSLNGRHGLPRTWEAEVNPNAKPEDGGIGESSAAVERVLRSYRNVFYFSGHSHMGLCGEQTLRAQGYASIETEGELHLLNLPSLACGNHCGENNALGLGFVLSVYDDRVVVQPRNFTNHADIDTVPIRDGKPYYEVKTV